MDRNFKAALAQFDRALALEGTPPPVAVSCFGIWSQVISSNNVNSKHKCFCLQARIFMHRASAHMLLDNWKLAEDDYKSVLDIAKVR